jgi:hypothetical protein
VVSTKTGHRIDFLTMRIPIPKRAGLHSVSISAAIISIPSQRFCKRMFSFAECWLLSWLEIGIVIV